MPNVFDQFDAKPQANVFDQFLPPAQQEGVPLPSQAPELAGIRAEAAKAGQEDPELERLKSIESVTRPVLQGIANLGTGITNLPRGILNASIGLANKAGANITPIGGLTDLGGGALKPRSNTEQLAAGVNQALGGAGTGIGTGQVLANSANVATAGVGSQLAAAPGVQAASAVTGAAGSEAARRGGVGPLGQAGVGILASLIPGGALGVGQKLASGVTRTPEAQRLLDTSVDLTPGQMNPKGFLNQLEETVQSAPFVGNIVRNARDNARGSFQRAAAENAAVPGANIPQGTPAEMLAKAGKSFEPLYDQAKGFQVTPKIVNANGPDVPLSKAFADASKTRGVLATPSQRRAIETYLDHQLGSKPKTSEDFIALRSNLREKARDLRAAQRTDEAELIDEAEAAVTKVLESQLPQKPLAALQQADAKYGDYKTLQNATARAKDRPDGFTPNDLSEAVASGAKGANQGSYARGGGGPLRELASDARKSFDVRTPATGARLGALPVATVLSPGILAITGTKVGRQLAAGNTAAQRAVTQKIGSIDAPAALKNAALGAVLRAASGRPEPQDQQILQDIQQYDKK